MYLSPVTFPCVHPISSPISPCTSHLSLKFSVPFSVLFTLILHFFHLPRKPSPSLIFLWSLRSPVSIFAERTRTPSFRRFCLRSSSDFGSRAPPCGHHEGLDGGEGERPSKRCCGVARDIQRWCDPRQSKGTPQRLCGTPGDDV